MKTLAVIAALLTAMVVSTSANAVPVPPRLTQQGRLFQKGTSMPATGTLSFVFSIYGSPTGGTALWTETFSVTLDDGYFSVQLGSKVPFPASLWDGSVRYIGMKVGPDEEMSPREEVASVPYALAANDVTGDIHPASVSIGNKVVIDGSGKWVGDSAGLQGPPGKDGKDGAPGTPGTPGSPGPAGVPCAGCVNTASIADGAVTSAKVTSIDGSKITGALAASSAVGALDTRIATLEANTPSSKSAFRAVKTQDQVMAQANSSVPIIFDSEIFDLNNEYNPSTGIFTASQAGVYALNCAVGLSPATGSGVNTHFILKSPGSNIYIASDRKLTGTDHLGVSVVERLTAGQQVACFIHIEAMNISTSGFQWTSVFSGARLY